MNTINPLCDLVRETSYAIHVYHSHGHLEQVYENAFSLSAFFALFRG